jgi:Outer membrane protein beta-barrel domain
MADIQVMVSRSRWHGVVLSAMLLLFLPDLALSDWTLGADAQLRHDNNVGNAGNYDDIVGDTIVDAKLSMSQLFPLGENYSLSVGGDLSGEYYDRLTGLNSASLGGALAVKRKWGLGAYAPWARVGLSIAHSDYNDDYRNATVYRTTLAAGQRLDERWNLSAEYAYERRAASSQPELVPGISGDAYSQTSQTLTGNAEYALNESTFLVFGPLLRYGDVVSTAEPSLGIFSVARAIAADPAFGAGEYAYKLTGTTFGFRIGINYSPTPHSLVALGFQRLDTHADGGNDYTKSIPEISWDYRF